MSEYQFVAFHAVDGPVSAKNLEYMRKQSSRAEITPWSFENEYDYSDFNGDALEMLRRGYDVHLHYANFGIRTLMIRLPHGFPDPAAVAPDLEEDSLCFRIDPQGAGGAFSISPYYESGSMDELWRLDEFIEELAPLRAEILAGDLRPLYLAHLAISCDDNHGPDETTEAPVPAGLAKLSPAQTALAEFYGLSDSVIAAAAKASSPLPTQPDPKSAHLEWIQRLPETNKNTWLLKLLGDPAANVRAEMLFEFRSSQTATFWPVTNASRTMTELQAIADEVAIEVKRKGDAQAAKKRVKLLSDMAADPGRALRETEQLTNQGPDGYRKIADLLADLHEALAGSNQAGLAEQQARKLKDKIQR